MSSNFFFSLLCFSCRIAILKHTLNLSACQRRLGQARDPWPLTVKLTLPPVACCAKCQERPLILSCCLVGHSAPDYCSSPDHVATYQPQLNSAAGSPGWRERPPTHSNWIPRLPTEEFFFVMSNKMMQQKSCSFELKLFTVKVGEKWNCEILPEGWKSAEGRWN